MNLGKRIECGTEGVRGRLFRSRLVTEEVEQKGKRALPASVTPQIAMEPGDKYPQYFFSFLLQSSGLSGGTMGQHVSNCTAC